MRTALRNYFVCSVLSVLSSITLAAANPLSVHVLDLQNGLPSPSVSVTLEKQNGQNWIMLNRAQTNEQGRITRLYPEGRHLENGTYRVTF